MRVKLETTHGPVVLELDEERAPQTVENFLRYVREGFYDGTIFHRVIGGFMIQGGGLTANLERKPTGEPIPNEAAGGQSNLTGTIAMARTADPHSATAQFFINTADNTFLDHQGETPEGWGYAVFGRVVEGMEVVRRIEGQATGSRGGYQDVPLESVVIERATLLESE
ncbi:MAG: peptidyl-prolyl cis-trans isomerase [Gammaproteobacteria bacterium]|nr:MAG: peptidyl-prolyl cis-trans isomerase [Gammaproteobacteria bacterium]